MTCGLMAIAASVGLMGAACAAPSSAACNAAALTRRDTADWKFYAYEIGKAGLVERFGFWDASTRVRESDGTVRVWLKFVTRGQVKEATRSKALSKAIVDVAARKVACGYVPPFLVVEPSGRDLGHWADVVSDEVTADIAGITPEVSAYAEVDCRERRFRPLYGTYRLSARVEQQSQPGSWEYVPPEGNMTRLLRMLCSSN